MKKILLVMITLVAYSKSNAQSKFIKEANSKYCFGLSETGDAGNFKRSDGNIGGVSFRFTGLFGVNNKLQLGAGAGIEKLFNPDYTTLPVYGALRYFPFAAKKAGFCLLTNAGYALPVGNAHAGFLSDVGMGLDLAKGKTTALQLQGGYSFQQISIQKQQANPASGNSSVITLQQNRSSLFVALAIRF